MKYIKLFEEYSDEYSDDDWKKLTRGEKAAITRGYEIMTEEQAAFCYVIASEIGNKLIIPGTSSKFVQTVPVEQWPAWVDMKEESIRRAVEKFKVLLGLIDSSLGGTIYPKLKKFHNQFANMETDKLLRLAGAALDKPDEKLKSKYKKKEKFDSKDVDNAGRMIKQNLTIPFVKNLDKAINLYAKSKHISPEEAKRLYVEYQRIHKK